MNYPKVLGGVLAPVSVWVLLAGCTSNVMHTSLGQPEYLPETKGFVAVQVVSNTGQLTPVFDHWHHLEIENLENTEAEYRLQRLWTGFTKSDFFVGALPPGRYRLESLGSLNVNSENIHRLDAPVPESMGTFTVAQDRLANLGTLVFQPLASYHGDSEIGEVPFAVLRLGEDGGFSRFVTGLFPWVSGQVATSELSGWDHEDDSPGTALEIVKQHMVPGRAVRLSNGGLVLPSALGQIYWFDPNEEAWQREDTGVSQKVEYVASTDDDGLLAVGERGLVMISEGWGQPWREIPGPGSTHKIQWVYQHPDGSTFVLTRTVHFTHLLRRLPESRNWEEIHRFGIDYDRRFTGRIAAFAHVEDDRLVIFADSRRHEFDFDGNLLESSRSRNFWDMAMQPDGTLVIGTLPGFNRPRYSRDGGQTWIKANGISEEESLLRGMGRMLHVDQDGNEWMLSNMAQTAEGFWKKKIFPHEPRLRRMDRSLGALSWHGLLPATCEEIDPVLTTGGRFFVHCGSGGLVSGSPADSEWTFEVTPLHRSSSIDEVDFRHTGTLTFSREQTPTIVVPIVIP